MRLGLDADGVLTTTRSVRKRLDLEKPVEREVVEECLDIALQAPTGSNTQGWQWVFITDPEKKRVIADFYGANYDAYTNRPDQPSYGDDDPRTSQRPKIMDSSRYLREIFHEVPVMMIRVFRVLEGLIREFLHLVKQAHGVLCCLQFGALCLRCEKEVSAQLGQRYICPMNVKLLSY